MSREDTFLKQPVGEPGNWMLDPRIVFLNHGSFGSCPRPVLDFQQGLRDRMERQPVQFLVRELEGLLDEARGTLAGFLGAQPDDLVFVPNATAGVNTVLRSLEFKPSDELLITDHEYNACRNALEFAARRSGATTVVAKVPFPARSADEIVDAILGRVTPRTRLALVNHVTSQTGMVLPIARLVSWKRAVLMLWSMEHMSWNDAAEFDYVGRGVLHGQLPRMAVRAQNRRFSVRPAGPAKINPPAVHQPRGEFTAHGPVAFLD